MRTVTCDRCGKEIGVGGVRAVLLAGGGYSVQVDLCVTCLSIVRSDLLALIDTWPNSAAWKPGPERGEA